MKKLSDSEFVIMKALWGNAEPLTSNQIFDVVHDKLDWKLATLMTALARMVEKGYVYCDRSTRTNYYSAIVLEEQYKIEESRSFLERLHDNGMNRNMFGGSLSMRKILIMAYAIVLCVVFTACHESEIVQCDDTLKQLVMFNEKSGWAVSAGNEILITENGVQEFNPIRQITDINIVTDGFINAAFPDKQTAYITYFSQSDEKLVVEHTHDSGESWNKALISYQEYAETCDAGSAFLGFADEKNGYLLYCSTPALGQMTKLLFATEDGGEHFMFVSDLTNEVSGYPSGITFTDKENGYIAVTYHGTENYLYRTDDGAQTWQSVEVYSKDEAVLYVDGFAPVFYGENYQKGSLILKEVKSDDTVYRLFLTNDEGVTWEAQGEIICDTLTGYSVDSDGYILVIDGEKLVHQRLP